MNAFPLLAAFTLCISFAVLCASFDDLREAPLTLDRGAALTPELFAQVPIPGGPPPRPTVIATADEGLLDHELASADPLQAWLDRYLTPPAQ